MQQAHFRFVFGSVVKGKNCPRSESASRLARLREWASATRLFKHSLVCWLVLLASSARAQTFEAFTEPFRTVDVASAETGRIAEVHIRRGDRVRRGDLLMTLDSQVLEATWRVAEKKAKSETRLQALQVELEVKKDRYTKLRELLDDGAGSPEEVRRAMADADVARLSVEAAREDQELARLQLAEIQARIEQRLIRSPIDGVVTDVLKEPGEHVSTMAPHVVTVVQLDRLRATFYLPTETASRLAIGSSAPLRIYAVSGDVTGKVDYVAPVTEADSGRVRVDLLMENNKGMLRSGVRCKFDTRRYAERNKLSSLKP